MRDNIDQRSPEEMLESQAFYFDFMAETGVTKHPGALNATLELIELCHIGPGQYVLDVGCGVGITACYLAKRYGCQVVGVDFTEKMIERSEERARRQGVERAVEFKVADARDLPFEDDLFDAVIAESVNVFLVDKARAVGEYVRVTRPGGYVGIDELTLVKPSPPAEFSAYVSRTTGIQGELPTADTWEELVRDSGLREIVARVHQLSPREEARSRIKRHGLWETFRGLGRMFSLYFRSPAAKGFVKEALLQGTKLTSDLVQYLGYGVYVGRK